MNNNLTAEILTLLEAPGPKSDEWQTRAGQLSALLSVRLLDAQLPIGDWMKSATLLQRAQDAGVKEARKRQVGVQRFAVEPPADLDFLESPEDQCAWLQIIASVRAAWVWPYVKRSLNALKNDSGQVGLLVRWGKRNSADLNSFLTETIMVGMSVSSDIQTSIFKETLKLTTVDDLASSDLAASFDKFVTFCTGLQLPDDPEEKIAAAVASILRVYLESCYANAPLLTFEATFPGSARNLAKVRLGRKGHLEVRRALERVSRASASALATLHSRGLLTVEAANALFHTLKDTLPQFEKHLQQYTTRDFVGNGSAGTGGASQEGSSRVEAAFATLLAAWAQARSGELAAANFDALLAMTIAAANAVSVDYLGEHGQLVRFDPLEHRFNTQPTTHPTTARIARPGIRVLRPDGSYRVVVPATVIAGEDDV
jgi:hypothetical protein